MISYEQRLDDDLRWALDEANRFFAGQSAVHHTLQALSRTLTASGIDYAVIGAPAMFFHGFRRFTENVDVLVTPTGLEQLDQQLLGRGYHRPSDWRRGIRDDKTGVAVHISKLNPIFREQYAKLWQFAQMAKADDY